MHASRKLAVLCALGVSALAPLALGQDLAAAKALFNQGVSQMIAGSFEKACPAIEASYKMDPRPGTLFTLAECESKRGRLATAAARYDDYLSMYSRLPADQQHKQGNREKTAREQKAALNAEAPVISLALADGAPKETVVKRDGSELAAAALGVPLPVDPGEHVFTTQVRDGEVAELRVTVAKGDKKQVTLPVKVAAATAPATASTSTPATATPVAGTPPIAVSPGGSPATGADQGPSGRRVVTYVAGAVGVAGLVLGGVTGGLTLGKKSTINSNCGIGGDATACNGDGLAAASDAKTLGLLSTIGFGVGGAGVVTAVVLLLTEPKHAPATTGVHASVFSAGREGTMIGFKGAW